MSKRGADVEVLGAHIEETAAEAPSPRNLPDSMIEQCEEQGLNWTQMGLEAREVELTNPRDTEKDVARVVSELSKKHTTRTTRN